MNMPAYGYDIPVIMHIFERIVILDFRRKIAEGPPQEGRANPAYPGVKA
jgi:ABC-type branched-subunit amino acid transport system ATPase component